MDLSPFFCGTSLSIKLLLKSLLSSELICLKTIRRVNWSNEDLMTARKGYAVTIDTKTGKELLRHPRVNGTYRFKAKLRAPNAPKRGADGPPVFRRQG